MTFNDITFNETLMPKGIQAKVRFGGYDLSIVQNEVSYGGRQGLYEIAIFKGDGQVEMPGITEEGDTVKGFLTESDVESIIKKMYTVTGQVEYL
tara:strand:- start:3907 stop:4188 length:282 start_codon:yes stop_codon:yes gene_type:complete